MQGENEGMGNFRGHLRTITQHRHMVIRHCSKAGILWRGLMHDLSKYSPSEFWVGVKYYKGTKSPNEGEREDYGYSKAWIHHKGRNKHHFEYWTDYDRVTHVMSPVKMPLVFVKEMFCDRVAASKIYQGDKYTPSHPIAYFRRGTANRSIHPETAALLESWLVILDEQGEEAAFRAIRNCKSY